MPDGEWHYRNGDVLDIAHVMPVSREHLRDAQIWERLRRLMFGPPLEPWERYVHEHHAAGVRHRAALAAAKRVEVRAVTPVQPLTVEALLGVLEDVWGVDAAQAAGMVQPWCECGQDSGGGIDLCAHHEDLATPG